MQYINDNLKVEGQITQNDGKNVLDTSSVVNNSPTLSYGTTSTIGSVGGTALKVTMPNKPSYNLNEISETNTRFFKKVAPRYDITESNWYSIGTIEDHAIYKIQVNSIWHYTAMTLLNFTVAFGYELQRTKVILHDVYLSKSKAFSKFRLVQIDPRVLRIDVYYTKNLYNEMYACIECCTKGMLGKTKVNTTTTIAPEITTEPYKEYDLYSYPCLYDQPIRANGFIVPDGTSSQFLKGDGSVDNNTYLTTITSSMVTSALGYTPVSDVSGKADKSNTVATAQYNNITKKIEFYNIDGTKLATDIDATDFIKDGMVNEVKVENGKLIITFNTDAGKDNIEIDINTIFNANNYYTKAEIDGKGYLTEHQDISGKANISDLSTVATSGDYNDLSNKPTIPTVPANISAFTNDVGYITEHQSLEGYVNNIIYSGEGNGVMAIAKQGSILQIARKEFLTAHQEVIANNPTLDFGQADIVIGKVGDTEFKVKMPELPNITDEKVKQTHTSANSNRSILLATNSGTGTVTDGTYKNSGVTVNTSTKKITSSGFVVNGSSSDYMLLGDGTTQAEHNTRNHQSLFIDDVNVANDFINNYYKKFIEGEDEIDTFIIAPFVGGTTVGGTTEGFDFSVLTYKIQTEHGVVSKKRFHIYLEYIQDIVYLRGCLSDTNWLTAGWGGKLECYFDENMNVWYVAYNRVMQCREGDYFTQADYKDYCYSYIQKKSGK